MKSDKKNIRHLSLSELEQYFETIGEKKFRSKQVFEWLWLKHASSFEDMSNISKDLKAKMTESFSFPSLKVDTTQYSEDGTIKNRFKTHDGHLVEGVLITAEYG